MLQGLLHFLVLLRSVEARKEAIVTSLTCSSAAGARVVAAAARLAALLEVSTHCSSKHILQLHLILQWAYDSRSTCFSEHMRKCAFFGGGGRGRGGGGASRGPVRGERFMQDVCCSH